MTVSLCVNTRVSLPPPCACPGIRYHGHVTRNSDAAEVERLARELEQAEAYELRLRERIVAIRNELASGHTARALSLCNETLNEIDNATDVVAPSRPAGN